MKTKLRTVVLTLCLVVLMASMAVSVLGTEVTFSKKYVDSNTYTGIAAATKETTTSTACVYISAIYKADGSASTYSRLYAMATYVGESKVIRSGRSTDIPIPADYQGAGNYIVLYLMGYDPSLDCRVSGSWSVH